MVRAASRGAARHQSTDLQLLAVKRISQLAAGSLSRFLALRCSSSPWMNSCHTGEHVCHLPTFKSMQVSQQHDLFILSSG